MTTIALIAVGVAVLTFWGAALVHGSDLKRIADLQARLDGAGADVATALRQAETEERARRSYTKAAGYGGAADIALRVLDGGA